MFRYFNGWIKTFVQHYEFKTCLEFQCLVIQNIYYLNTVLLKEFLSFVAGCKLPAGVDGDQGQQPEGPLLGQQGWDGHHQGHREQQVNPQSWTSLWVWRLQVRISTPFYRFHSSTVGIWYPDVSEMQMVRVFLALGTSSVRFLILIEHPDFERQKAGSQLLSTICHPIFKKSTFQLFLDFELFFFSFHVLYLRLFVPHWH